jgi:3-oxoacyl-[acyl-carrier-protein] synthase II
MGAVTPLANDISSTWDRLLEGESGIGYVSLFDTEGFAVRISGEVRNFDPLDYIDKKPARRMDRNVQFAVAAARQALSDAEFTVDVGNRDGVGVVMGSAIGGIKTLLDNQKQYEKKGPNRLNPFFLQNMLPDAASGQVAISCGVRGPNMAIVSACASGGHAIGEAAELIRRGDAEVVLAGGTDAAIVPVSLGGFAVMRVLATENGDPTKACKPFDLHRDGFVMAEGAGVMVLESDEHARRRGAKIYAQVAGYGSSNDAYDLAAPAENGEGAVRSMAMALRKSGLSPSDISYINPHGTGTQLNDKYETYAIRQVFGDAAEGVMVSSTKSMLGHMMGAAGAVEAMVCALAVKHDKVPPTINYQTPDPECDLDYVPNSSREVEVPAALSNSIGLGGHNSTLIFRKHE